MIKTFKNRLTEDVFNGIHSSVSRKFPQNLHRSAQIRLSYLHHARFLSDLLVPPGNRFEALKGDLHGKYSIRINQQWRIVFEWEGEDALNVEIVDYH